jgi:hypothetical protein
MIFSPTYSYQQLIAAIFFAALYKYNTRLSLLQVAESYLKRKFQIPDFKF